MNVFALLKTPPIIEVWDRWARIRGFHLTIVGTEQVMARRRDEGFTNPETIVPFTRNILQIRIGGGESSRAPRLFG